MIYVKNLCKSFGSHQVLKNINEHIAPGEKVVIIGPSGSGKSTFLRCMNLLERPTSGQVIFDGVDITDPKTDINKIRQHMGMVFQHFNLFPHKTIMENITLAPTRLKLMKPDEAKEEALRLLRLVNLEEKADAYPGQLSGGQKQRIAIVRSLALKPKMMLFDEPTSALDPEMVGEVVSLVHAVISGGHSQQSGHSDFIRILILYFHFSFESIYYRGIQFLGKRDYFLVCSPTADAAEKSNAFMIVQQVCQLCQVFFCRTDFRRGRIIFYRRIGRDGRCFGKKIPGSPTTATPFRVMAV